jgi:tRNA(Ile)-lysidine synthase
MKIDKVPSKVYLALSGGEDSMFALHFLLAGRKDVTCLHFNHKTPESDKFEAFVREQCEYLGVELIVGELDVLPAKGESKEKYWRDARYKFFRNFTTKPIITVHHLEDQIETMLMGFCKGKEQRIHSELKLGHTTIIRPFLRVEKSEIVSYNDRHKVSSIKDESNEDVSYPRNRIRSNVIPELVKSYPGLRKTIKRKRHE